MSVYKNLVQVIVQVSVYMQFTKQSGVVIGSFVK
jgi:hypothetical protein